MSAPFALTAYPLTHDFRERLEAELDGVPEYLNVPHLRRLGGRRLLEELSSLSGRPCLLPLEDPASSAVLPVLEALALAARPSSIVVVHPDLRRETVSRWRVLPALGALGAASADGLWTLRTARKELARLLAAAPSTPTRGTRRRVLYLNGNLWFGVKAGGSLAHMAGVANGLADAGYELDLAASFHVPQLRECVRERVVTPPGAFAVPSETNYFRYQRSLVEHSFRVAAAHAPDFVYQRLSILNYAGVAISRRLGVPLVLEYNGSEVWVARHWGRPLRYERLAEQAEEALLRHAHVIVTVSDVLREELLGRGIPERRIVMYPNCVDAALFDPARFTNEDRLRVRARYGIPKDAFVATFVGTFGRWHGTDVLARAVRGLIEAEPEWLEQHRLRFLFVGDGLRMPEVVETLGGNRRGPHHVLAGLVPQAEAASHLFASDILLSPHVPNEGGSRFFGSPTKLFEYMAMERAIVASDLDQIGEVLQPSLRAASLPQAGPTRGAGEVAVLAEPGSVEQLQAGIRFLAEQAGWRAALGKNARAAAVERYTWDAHVTAFLERLEELCG